MPRPQRLLAPRNWIALSVQLEAAPHMAAFNFPHLSVADYHANIAAAAHAPVAQRIEHLPSKQRAAGSSPAGSTTALLVSIWANRLPCGNLRIDRHRANISQSKLKDLWRL